MKRFKKNQYRWFSQRKNTDTDDNPLTDILVVPSQNVNNSPALNEAASTHGGVENESPNQGKLHSVTVEDPNECSQPKESTSITYVESINDNSYSGESTSSMYMESINDNSQPNESTSITFVESVNDSSQPNESTSITFVESVNDSSQPNESTSIAFVESVNDSSQPNESTSITFVESVNDSSQPNESTSITFVESVNDSSQPNESTTITFVESVNDSSQPNESTTITFVESVNDSSQPNESTSITFVESVNDSSQPNESTTITFVESVNDSSQPNESTTITFVESVNDSSQPNESTSITFVESVNDSSQPNESTTITFVESVNDSSQPNESTTITFVESVNDSSQPNESTSITFVESVNDSSQPNESTSITFVESVNDSSQPNESTSITFVDSINDKPNIEEWTYENYEQAPSTIVFGILLIFVDIFLIMSDVLSNDNKIVLECHSISLAIAFFFFFDVLLRVYVEGRKTYFTDLFNILDAFIIAITLLIDTIYFFFDLRFLKHIPRVAILLRPLRLIILVRVFHLAYQNRQLQKLTRRLVSENKRRYRRDGFDLDLTYITDRIIAMSFPSSGKQSFYRNPIKEVVRFLDTKHPNHYRVYNLCSERAYNPEHFHNRVQRIMIDDHNVPTLSEMVVFTKEVNMWLAQDKENVVVIHCKGGKGRTGTMVCACLIANQIFGTAKESLAYFASRRTDHTISSKFQGIETPSQSRYVGYFENVKNLYNWTLPPKKILTPYKIIISSIHNVGKGDGSDLKIQIATKQQTVFSCSSSKNCKIFHDIETDRVIIELLNCPILYDDIKVRFLSRNLPKYYDKCAFFFWFNTAFIQNNRLYLRRNELDNPHKRKAWKIYSSCFSVEMHFTQT
ncbi:phosphatidylinositol 3,4,5-trisphosphate 3-phosphatase TPTE2-like isoform X34 [Lepus europaeus]|uniref:phosphatidylinositol 3,4,5-trisphosphate 3-phosphatase TPTE2-like isoform X34 n=1 Tax=Lepus europaeus TaxID=9983 RepID=UPI002B4A442E|nr:phosphatidylinositol 3,4,5-trisphosphate 3-phosphatase TPTE2-like isoform X34 [Lepus europaeus]